MWSYLHDHYGLEIWAASYMYPVLVNSDIALTVINKYYINML
jgi:hypothetical protein